jgi:hypothetical protein
MNNEANAVVIDTQVAPPLDLEAIRQKGIQKLEENLASRKASVASRVDKLVEFLQTNRDHIGGVMLTVIPIEGSALVDPVDKDACDAVISRICLHDGYFDILAAKTRANLDQASRISSSPFAALLGR